MRIGIAANEHIGPRGAGPLVTNLIESIRHRERTAARYGSNAGHLPALHKLVSVERQSHRVLIRNACFTLKNRVHGQRMEHMGFHKEPEAFPEFKFPWEILPLSRHCEYVYAICVWMLPVKRRFKLACNELYREVVSPTDIDNTLKAGFSRGLVTSLPFTNCAK